MRLKFKKGGLEAAKVAKVHAHIAAAAVELRKAVFFETTCGDATGLDAPSQRALCNARKGLVNALISLEGPFEQATGRRDIPFFSSEDPEKWLNWLATQPTGGDHP